MTSAIRTSGDRAARSRSGQRRRRRLLQAGRVRAGGRARPDQPSARPLRSDARPARHRRLLHGPDGRPDQLRHPRGSQVQDRPGERPARDPWRPKRPDHVSVPDYDPQALDVPEAELLGERQLKFLRHWAADWHDCDMKAVLSQTIFCRRRPPARHAGQPAVRRSRLQRLAADRPQQRPDRDAQGLRPAHRRRPAPGHDHPSRRQRLERFVLLVLCPVDRQPVPALVGAAGARQNREPGMPDYLGEFKDGLGNKITMLAVANPSPRRTTTS